MVLLTTRDSLPFHLNVRVSAQVREATSQRTIIAGPADQLHLAKAATVIRLRAIGVEEPLIAPRAHLINSNSR